MDEFERFMSRARAQWRARKRGKNLTSLWNFETWGDGSTEEHHVGGIKFCDITITIPRSMHPELTRRQMEEHPVEGPQPHNPLERQARVQMGIADLYDGLADGHRLISLRLHEAANRGEYSLSAVDISKSLLGWLDRIEHDLAAVAKSAMKDLDV
jgi:hypothetical protein